MPFRIDKDQKPAKKMRIRIRVIMVATTGLEPATTTMSR